MAGARPLVPALSPAGGDHVPQLRVDERLPPCGNEVAVETLEGRVGGIIEKPADLVRLPKMAAGGADPPLVELASDRCLRRAFQIAVEDEPHLVGVLGIGQI